MTWRAGEVVGVNGSPIKPEDRLSYNMIKLLQTPWVAALLGIVCYALTTVFSLHPPARVNNEVQAQAVRATVVDTPSWNFRNPEVEQLISDLNREKEAIGARRQELNDYAARLATERQEVNQVMTNITRLQKDFDLNVTRVRTEEAANLKRLAKVYAAMSPEGAGSILKELDDEQIVKILLFMKDAETAPVLESLAKMGEGEAKRAALLSERLRLAASTKNPPPKPTK
jgi:flagellar motility protein MotE (MotC chaperone)